VAELWREYEDQSTPESHLVKDFDKLEMIVQVRLGWFHWDGCGRLDGAGGSTGRCA
jgi:5'-deoxynucleotidase YfbR-like HD superfamily hydrolase